MRIHILVEILEKYCGYPLLSVAMKTHTHIINLVIDQNEVPKQLKSARVVPLFKKNKRCEGQYLKSWKWLFIHSWKTISYTKTFI